ncbi:Hypothetical protein A7982_00629 [Minicystis rosea]|nr:Hypothetical protein A7982_00629 [Minicystis rosea]
MTTSPALTLHSLGGGAPPPEIAADLLRLLELPEGAQQHIWEALGPSLDEPIPNEVEALLTRFARRHDAETDALSRALKACRFLLRAAALFDLDRARFAEDLERLAGDAQAARVKARLLPGFDVAKAHVRASEVRRTLADHGRVVEGVDWRIERIEASNRAASLDERVAVVTLRCREGDRRERITLYLDESALAELTRAHARLRA